MNSYTAYSEYRDSGVEWLGKVPQSWRNIPIKYMALQRDTLFLDGDWIESKDIAGTEIRYITTGNVAEGYYREQGSGYISETKFEELNCTEVKAGDILISRLNAPIGRACVVPDLGIRIVTSVDNVIFRPDPQINKAYLVYLFTSKEYFHHTSDLARGATMQRISRALLGNIRIVLPSELEQQKIANFLDHETAKIDTLIEKQQQLIKLLKEKRQAVISHAVTKGLHPDAQMKDSGVEWLGEMPEGWAISAIRHLGECQNGINIGADSFGKGYPFVSYGDVYNNEVLPETVDGLVESTEMDRYKYSVEVGDVFFTRTSETLEEIGFASTCMSTVAEATFAGFLIRFRPRGEMLDPRYSAYFFRNQKLRQFFGGQMNIVTRASLSQDLLKTMTVPLPPLATQYEIVNQLDIVSEKFNELEMRAYELKTILVERRTALVSAAVTGKIDVRNWQPPTPQTTSKDV